MSNAPTTTTASTSAPAQQPVAPAPSVATPIPGFDKMSFEQRRQAQDQNAAAARKNAR
jgi:hypothetical protein